jgi:hypothetical protein
MKLIDTVFDRMDSWRHLPGYQLERRADLFFSLYLPEVLAAYFGFPVAEQVVPEFPVRIGTIYPDKPGNASKKIDYLALSADAGKAIFVELKTEGLSRCSEQDQYLRASRETGFSTLLEGVLEIFRKTAARQKYFVLLEHLENMGLLRIPAELKTIMSRSNFMGAPEATRAIEITSSVKESIIVYVQPCGTAEDVITFADFRAIVQKYDDPVSQRFAQSLKEWAEIKAGKRTFLKTSDHCDQ